jgi:membrane-associated protease RseP (regulator of RpoE activity)
MLFLMGGMELARNSYLNNSNWTTMTDYTKVDNMKTFIVTLTTSVLVLSASMAFAHDFLGATVDDRDAPSDAFSAGIVGFRPIFHSVPSDSPAAIAGFQHGDIIMEVNGNKVKSTSDLGKYTSDTMSIIVLRGRSRKTLTIESKAFVAEKPITPEIEKHPASITTQQVINPNAQQDNSPPLYFNDAVLEKKYGKTTPAELARQRQVADKINKQDDYKKPVSINNKNIDADNITSYSKYSGMSCKVLNASYRTETSGGIVSGGIVSGGIITGGIITGQSNYTCADVTVQHLKPNSSALSGAINAVFEDGSTERKEFSCDKKITGRISTGETFTTSVCFNRSGTPKDISCNF